MSCELRTAWLDGRLDEGARSVYEQHLKSCPGCLRAAREWEQKTEVLDDWAATRSLRLDSGAGVALVERAANRRMRHRVMQAGGAAAAAAAVLFSLQAPVTPAGGGGP